MYLSNDVNNQTTLVAIFAIVVWIFIVMLLPGVAIFALLDPTLELPFPLSIHVVLALGVPVLATLSSWRILGCRRTLDRLTLLVFTLAVGIEIVATLVTLAMQALLHGVDDEPPAPIFLFVAAHRHSVILLCALGTLVLTIVDGRACLEWAHDGDDGAVLQTGIELYGTQRILFGGCLALASGNVWLAAAMPLACLAGLAIAGRDHWPAPAGLRTTALAATIPPLELPPPSAQNPRHEHRRPTLPTIPELPDA